MLETTEEGSERELDLVRRRVLALSRLMGREEDALEMFERLLDRDPFEPTAFRAMLELFEREKAHDRARLTRQVLSALNCEVERDRVRTKKAPSRSFGTEAVERYLLPETLDGDTFHLLMKLMPLAEKVCSEIGRAHV